MAKTKILVTGGTGYIGSHTLVELLNAGYETICIDNLSNSFADVLERVEQITSKKVTFFQGNLCNKELISQFLQKHSDIAGIIHFAAYKSVPESLKTPLKYYQNNIVSLLNLLEIAHSLNIRNFIFSSSCTVYGQPDILPVDETAPLKTPWSPYGNTKKICEEILRDYISANQTESIVSLRYFNPIGAHPSGIIGELPLGIPNNLLPYITQTAIGIREELKIYGKDYNTPDGTAIRDYIHVVDLAKAHVAAIERLLTKNQKNQFEIFNLGTGQGYSVLDVVNSFQENNGVEIKYTYTDRRPGDIEKIWANPILANRELNWKTQYSLDDMVKSTWKWEQYYRNNLQKNHTL